MSKHQLYYETMYILRPDIAEEEVNNHINKYNKLLGEVGGKILDSQMRGKRRLAYQIAKHREGIYVQLSHQGDGQHIFKIEKAMRLSEDVIRYLTVKQEGPLPTPRPANKNVKNTENKQTENTDPKNIENKSTENTDPKNTENKQTENTDPKNTENKSTENTDLKNIEKKNKEKVDKANIEELKEENAKDKKLSQDKEVKETVK